MVYSICLFSNVTPPSGPAARDSVQSEDQKLPISGMKA